MNPLRDVERETCKKEIPEAKPLLLLLRLCFRGSAEDGFLGDLVLDLDIRVGVYGNDDVGAEGAAERHGNGIDEPPVDEEPAFPKARRKHPRHGDACPDGFDERPFADPYLLTRCQIRCHGCERYGKILDVRVTEPLPQVIGDLLAVDETGPGYGDFHEPEHIRPGKFADESFRIIEFTRRIGSPHEGSDRGAADDIDGDIRFLQSPDDPDVGPAACRAAAEGKTDFSQFIRHRWSSSTREASLHLGRQTMKIRGHDFSHTGSHDDPF